ncbi:MAG: 4Fe-4S dicluster domain-containing protein [Acidobacteria bacterium]|nr:4Fe-4S dicluster domain-containing protein [Acidobacteriota bacterium]
MISTILKDDFFTVLRGLAKTSRMIAPVMLSNGELLYDRIQCIEDVSLQPGIPIMSAKEFFFSSCEELFRFKRIGTDAIDFVQPEEAEACVFLGIRSCDLNGVRYLERFYKRKFNDTTVTKKIEKTVFISLGCLDPGEQCFCACCDSGPFLSDGFDAQLTDLDNRWMVEIATARAETLLRPYDNLFTPATDADLNERKNILSCVDSKFTRRSFMAMGVKKVSLGAVEEEVWEAFGDRCISCGSCVFVCPTCSCFNVLDREIGEEGVRLRTWDACSYSGFTREVSGHNPRPRAADRLKRRFFHKLSYQTTKDSGRLGCMGCGRCVVSCPSLADISTFVTTLRSVRTV